MKVVVFDLLCSQPVGSVKFHGGGEYTKTVFRALLDYIDASWELVVCFNRKAFIDEWVLEAIDSQSISVKDVSSYDEIVAYLNEISKNNEVRFFAGIAYGYTGKPFSGQFISIGTCHGLRAVEKQYDRYTLKYYSSKLYIKELIKILCSRYFSLRYHNRFATAIEKFNYVITDSNHSAYSIMLNYREIIENKQVKVFYPITQPITPFIESDEIKSDAYIMMISANRWIKNSFRGLRAIDNLYSKGFLKGIKTRVYGNAPKRIKKSVKNRDKFEFFQYVSNEELETAYKNCELLFYPTLNEGFGNVPMEAMKYGKTCVISAVCSLPEVYEQSVYYCNPYDIMEMGNRILQATEKKIEKSLINRRLTELNNRQAEDLKSLCKLITDTEE